MKKIIKYNHNYFKPEELLEIKGDKKIYAVFSTFGEREADLVIDKISVLKKLPAGLIDRIIINHRRAGENFDRTESGISSAYKDADIMVSMRMYFLNTLEIILLQALRELFLKAPIMQRVDSGAKWDV